MRSESVEARVDRFLERATRLKGIDEVGRVQAAPGGTIAMVSLQLDRRAWDVPVETGETLIDRAQAGEGVRIELAGGPIQAAQEAFSPEAAALVGRR